ncbi:IS481 family transposase [Burkholderia multivorans]|uniref:IS481 family transposase n=1 Tax=Burkholderia multivorans TaxID=87883 RepID=UPI00201A1C54|nr:IS481 family transposase [Burkholderia multivorans]MCO1344512.1 IS481 family transposase [Burkholderia multivorans]MCO1441834.1 IS481 family transposase [Burkholderia multivorans]UQO28299.1 IS481 family transposase [Burkholderia multivorans]UQO41631.1 IS481 family transposase [Burkholderia multivorans]
MHLRLHKNATTTPRIRAEIQVSKEPMRVLAQRFGVSVCTIARWKKRASVHDASHTPHRLQTTLTPAQESIVLVLRKSLGLSLDDLLAVVREFIHPTISRAALHRMLKRHGVSAREALSVDRPRTKPFKAYEPGFVHIDVKYLPQMADETTRRYLFVAIDRATRWVFVRVYASKSATNARRFLKELHKAAAFRIRTILTDNGKEFTDRFITRGERTPTGRHQFDQLCEELGIEHRLTRPKHPQTNGMVERFNGRIADILRTHHFHCGEELEATILRYVWLYNHQLPQKALGHVSPIQAMKQWQRSHPELFNRRVTNQPGHDTYEQECRDAGRTPDAKYLIDLRFHDLRHEATSRLASIFPMHELAKITGHRDPRMLMRYYHPSAEDLAKRLR